ncbi:hypothetical protein MRS44_006191 [Fusarium solani]|uniref:Uncharacterized protein n=1 Tax=Fusarium solani subsp. cucurbitae TaxID=2747967 RepID=A0ACD3ZAW1_FUSSC|nr:hypothetical protein MRS44_006191 [Fusarium solani]KAJ4220356.1 hypothetical protein NW759_007242 [Fusarium solani]UPK97218.1 hypothetical protein LCI18_008153 [Fusarium solani-melongenae]
MDSHSGKRHHDDSIDSASPVPSKKYKQATSFGSDTSATTATSTGSIELDYPAVHPQLRLDTLLPAFKSVQYDRPTVRSRSPQPPSPRSH